MKKLIIFLLCSFAAVSQASIPRVITLQGFIRDQSGNPVIGTHVIKFYLYDQVSGGNVVFHEILSVTVSDGLYSTQLGAETPLPDSISFDKQYFLGIVIDNGAELTPRTPLTTVPSAFISLRATIADSLNSNASAAPSGPAGGDLSGTYPKPLVTAIQAQPVASITPQKGQTLTWDGTQWAASSANTPVAFNVIGGTFQSLTTSIDNKIDFTQNSNSGTFDDAGNFSLTNDEFTAPSDGYYYFQGIVTLDTRGAGAIQVYLTLAVNGNTSAYNRFYDLYSGYPAMQLGMPLKLKTGDKVSLLANPGKTISTMGGNSYGVVRFSGFKIN